jgi:ribosome-associated protein
LQTQPIVKVGSEVLTHLIIECLQDKKANDIRLLDLRDIDDAPADYFIVCEGSSNTQVKALGDYVQYELKQRTGIYPGHVEGERNALWVLIDYFDIVVHIFYRETREFYQLEDLWSDAKVTQFEEM